VEEYGVPRKQARFQLVHDCIPAGIFKPQSASIVQGDGNKQDLLAREVVEAQLSPY